MATRGRGRAQTYTRFAAVVVGIIFAYRNLQASHRGLDTPQLLFGLPMLAEQDNEAPSLSAAAPPPPPPRRYGTVNLNQPSAGHPRGGGVDEYGWFGYVHEPTILRHRPQAWPFAVTPEEEADLCAPLGNGPEGYGDLGRQIFGDRIRVSDSTTAAAAAAGVGNVKVFCAVYTHPANNNQTEAIRQTWGQRCDGFLAASTETVHEAATVNIPHHGPHQGLYKGIWQRVRSILGYFYDNFLDEYDFIFLSGDDTYVIMENLKAFLTSPSFVDHAGGPTYPRPVFAGAWIHPFWMEKEGYSNDFYYMGGGAGYVLSRSAVRALVETVLPVCHDRKVGSAEDVLMADCLQRHLNVTGYDTRDEEERGRFFDHDVVRRADVKAQRVPVRGQRGEDRAFRGYIWRQNDWLQQKHSWTPKYGVDCVSPSAISFHKVQPAIKMRRYERMIYRMRDEKLDRLDCGRFHTWRNTTLVQMSDGEPS
jgi:glycoprotein-N-acetylgalactosamine 3-beta-galactosyltransferase